MAGILASIASTFGIFFVFLLIGILVFLAYHLKNNFFGFNIEVTIHEAKEGRIVSSVDKGKYSATTTNVQGAKREYQWIKLQKKKEFMEYKKIESYIKNDKVEVFRVARDIYLPVINAEYEMKVVVKQPIWQTKEEEIEEEMYIPEGKYYDDVLKKEVIVRSQILKRKIKKHTPITKIITIPEQREIKGEIKWRGRILRQGREVITPSYVEERLVPQTDSKGNILYQEILLPLLSRNFILTPDNRITTFPTTLPEMAYEIEKHVADTKQMEEEMYVIPGFLDKYGSYLALFIIGLIFIISLYLLITKLITPAFDKTVVIQEGQQKLLEKMDVLIGKVGGNATNAPKPPF